MTDEELSTWLQTYTMKGLWTTGVFTTLRVQCTARVDRYAMFKINFDSGYGEDMEEWEFDLSSGQQICENEILFSVLELAGKQINNRILKWQNEYRTNSHDD